MKSSATRIRLTEKERTDLDNLSIRLHISRSELIRQFIRAGIQKNESAHIIKWDNDTISVIRDYNMLIAKIGINVNQIARSCNSGNYNVTLANEVRSLQYILDCMKKVVERCL